MRIKPARRIRGRLKLPGDKSISHRGAIIAALAGGRSTLENYSTSEDCARTLRCLRDLGVRIESVESGVCVTGVGREGFVAPLEPLDCGNSGSTMRMLAGVLAGQDFVSVLTGDKSLRARPMRRVIEPLELMGARISSAQGLAPLRIAGRRPLAPISYRMPVASAQVKSCLLLAGLNAEGRTEVIEKGGLSRDHTERMLRWFGVTVETRHEQDDGDALCEVLAVKGPASFAARDLSIPGDISSAVFFIAAAALLPRSELLIEDVGVNPTRRRILEVLSHLQADVKVEDERERSNETVGTIRVRSRAGHFAPAAGSPRANKLEGSLIAQLIDELPMLAVIGTQVSGGLTIRDAAELRVKESDRIAAVVANLRAMGAEVEEYEDGLAVGGPTRLRGAKLDAFGDHRIAMAFTIAALIAEGESEIARAESSVGVSFPDFFPMLESVVER